MRAAAQSSEDDRQMRTSKVTIADVTFIADVAGALFWKEQRLLIVSDLHLEKGSSYARRGVLLPPYDTLATLTGTPDQISVSNGAGSITLALPQAIASTSTPQFARLGLGTGAGATAVITTTGQFDLGLVDNGNSTAAATINWNSGQVQKITLTAAPVALTLSNPIAGSQYTVLFIQDGTGSRTVTWPATVKWPAGTPPTLTTAAGAVDMCTFRWDGTNYRASCQLNFS